MHFSNMTENPSSIQPYSLFGESQHLPDVLHCETITARSVLHDWELAPHRHQRLHQVLLIESGGGVAPSMASSTPWPRHAHQRAARPCACISVHTARAGLGGHAGR
ncbi:hypothetical protein [Acidovorax sp.]|uniref:hypothetical protein n=1 Tax=Acidovorax sp. TaxID=1872122 RepID=UPI002613DFC6|nr:hypothetical protein [Acidovorax sp.]